MSQCQLWKKRSGGLTNKLTEQRSNWLSPTDTSRKAVASVSGGKRKAGLKRRGN